MNLTIEELARRLKAGDEASRISIAEAVENIAGPITAACENLGLPRPVFLDERGRWATWGQLDDLHERMRSKLNELPGTLDQNDVYALIGMHQQALHLLAVMLNEVKK